MGQETENNQHGQPAFEDVECLVPASPELEERIRATQNALRSEGAVPEGDEFLDLQTFLLIKSRPPTTRSHTLVAKEVERAPVVGTRKALVLLVDFSDKAAGQSQQHYNDMLFSSGSWSTGSMRDYYWEVSYHKLTVTGEVAGTGGPTAGWFRAPRDKVYYTNGNNGFGSYPRNAQKLVEDVVDVAAPHVNFADYDNDGDGIVDALVIIAAGSGAEVTGNPNDIWSHKWAIAPRTHDGVQITGYFMAPEDGRVGVMAHELGHLLLGAPDLYDTDYSSRGTGRWDLMAGGSWNNGGNTPAHPVAWLKAKVGWVNPVSITSGTQYVTIPPYTDNEAVYKIPIGSATSKEYFMVSNRRRTGFDSHLPGEGCCIEHCDDNQSNNTDETHYLVDIEQADGQFHLNSNANSGDAGDMFPTGSGSGSLTESTTPNSNSYSGAASQISVTDIQRSGANVTATIAVGGGTTGLQWLYNKKVTAVFASVHAQNAWALIDGVGWRRVATSSADGVTNLFSLLTEACASNGLVHVNLDAQFIYIAYLA